MNSWSLRNAWPTDGRTDRQSVGWTIGQSLSELHFATKKKKKGEKWAIVPCYLLSASLIFHSEFLPLMITKSERERERSRSFSSAARGSFPFLLPFLPLSSFLEVIGSDFKSRTSDSIWGSVRQSTCPSVRPSVRPPVRPPVRHNKCDGSLREITFRLSKPSGFFRGRASAGLQRRRWSVESVAFKPQNDATITSEHLQNNFQNVKKTTLKGLWKPQNDPLRGPNFDLKFCF